MIVNVKIISFYFANISSGNQTANIKLQNSYFTITQCQKNPADCVMVKLEFCNVEKVIFAVLYLQH